MTTEDILKWLDLDEPEFRKKIAEFVVEKPWEHDWDILGCPRCKATKGLEHPACPIPPPVTDCLEKVAFKERDKCIDAARYFEWCDNCDTLRIPKGIPKTDALARIWICSAIITLQEAAIIGEQETKDESK